MLTCFLDEDFSNKKNLSPILRNHKIQWLYIVRFRRLEFLLLMFYEIKVFFYFLFFCNQVRFFYNKNIRLFALLFKKKIIF